MTHHGTRTKTLQSSLEKEAVTFSSIKYLLRRIVCRILLDWIYQRKTLYHCHKFVPLFTEYKVTSRNGATVIKLRDGLWCKIFNNLWGYPLCCGDSPPLLFPVLRLFFPQVSRGKKNLKNFLLVSHKERFSLICGSRNKKQSALVLNLNAEPPPGPFVVSI